MDEALIRKQEEELQHTGRYYKHICFLCVPLLFVSCYLYGRARCCSAALRC